MFTCASACVDHRATSHFAPEVKFVDAQYTKPFMGKAEVEAYLRECAESLPGWEFIIDDHAEDLGRRKVGLKWHVSGETMSIVIIPVNRGADFNAEGVSLTLKSNLG
jgi:hypothetical protein